MNSAFPCVDTRLFELVSALRQVAALTVHGPARPDLPAFPCVVLDAQDARGEPTADELDAGILVLTGTGRADTGLVRSVLATYRPKAVLLRCDDVVPLIGGEVGVPLIAVSTAARWSRVVDVVTRFARDAGRERSRGETEATFGDHTDLFGLAKTLGAMTGTLISIEDDQSRVLAFSPYSDQADSIRRLAILGREPPAWHVAQLRSQGVFERLRHPGATVELAADGDVRRRLGCGMLDPATGAYVGTIWAQETEHPFGDDLGELLLAASRYAARLIGRTRQVHTMGTELVQRMLAPDLQTEAPFVQQLSLEPPDDFTVVGFEAVDDQKAREWLCSAEAVAILSMRAHWTRDEAMVAPHDGRLYAILPGPPDVERHAAWALQTLRAMERYRGITLRAAMSSSLSASSVVSARHEVERVCASTAYAAERPVVTLDNERTAVLLSEALTALPRTLLDDARFQNLVDYDRTHAIGLLETAAVWLATHGDIRATAQALLTHTNTVRYRLSRLEKVSGYHLDQTDDRLLLQLQVRLWLQRR